MRKEYLPTTIVFIASAAVAYVLGAWEDFAVAIAISLFFIAFDIIFSRKISIKHPLFYGAFHRIARQSLVFTLVIFIIYEIIPPETVFYGISGRKLFISLLVLVISWYMGNYIEEAISTRKNRENEQNVLLGKSIKYTFLFIVSLALLKYLNAGNEVKNIVIGAGFLSIVLGLAAQSTISNIIAGLLIVAEKPFHVGETIQIDNEIGTVIDIKLMSTYIQTIDNKLVRIPNTKVYENAIVNYRRDHIVTIREKVSISYSSDVPRARKIIIDTLDSINYVLKYPAPFVEVSDLADSGVVLEIWYSIQTHEFIKRRETVLTKIYNALKENNIEIPFPQRVNWFANELKIKIDKENSLLVNEDYVADAGDL